MPRVHYVKKAQKNNPVCSTGESYYWWKFRKGGKQYSLTPPKASQLTGSAYFKALYDLHDQVEQASPETVEDFESLRDEIVEAVRAEGEQCQESRDNMPEGLQDAPTGELLGERVDACEAAADEIESMEGPDEWQTIADQQEEHDEWEGIEPQIEDYKDDDPTGDDPETAEEKHQEAMDDWNAEEPEVDEMEPADLSEMLDAISNCIV